MPAIPDIDVSKAPFPCRLHACLDNARAEGHENIVSWTNGGSAFCIYEKDAFESRVMPVYFPSQSKFKSFLRQLYLYNFDRPKRGGRNKGCWSHDQFIRGEKDLCTSMRPVNARRGKRTSAPKCQKLTRPSTVRRIPIAVPPVQPYAFDFETAPLPGLDDISLNIMDCDLESVEPLFLPSLDDVGDDDKTTLQVPSNITIRRSISMGSDDSTPQQLDNEASTESASARDRAADHYHRFDKLMEEFLAKQQQLSKVFAV